ncbi:MAG: hypothetical protein WC829_01045 [Hyphomicrobium sp.]|jgi:hypothetical protein
MDEQLQEHGAQLEHVDTFARPVCPRTDFDAALLRLLFLQAIDGRNGKCDGRRRAMVEALDNRATWIQIRHWRRGTGRVPQWAKDLIASKIAKRRQLDADAESRVRAA